jgi:hypothetical protein
MMPFPARGLHTFSHVRYARHMNWTDQPNLDPYRKLDDYERETRVDHMVRDVARCMPAVKDALYADSLFEIKTILVKNEGDHGRPILLKNTRKFPAAIRYSAGR